MNFKISQRRKKNKVGQEQPKVWYSVALVMAFLTTENKNRQLEDLPLTDFGRVPGKEKVFNCEFCELKVIPFFRFCYDSTYFPILRLIADNRRRTLRLFYVGYGSYVFHLSITSTFLVRKGLLCLSKRQ